MKEEEIILGVRSGNPAASLEYIYKNFPMVKRYVVANGGSSDEAKDVFQESIVIFYRLCFKPDFILSSSISTLIFAISKKLWLKYLRDYHSKKSDLEIGDQLLGGELMEEAEIEVDQLKIMKKVLDHLGHPCESLLIKFYYEKLSMKEIAEMMGYSGEKTAKAQKYKCLERAKKMVMDFKDKIFVNR